MGWTLDHLALNVGDVEKSLRFYSEVLGLALVRADAFHSGKAPFPSIRINAGTIIDLLPRIEPNSHAISDSGMGTLNHFCLALPQAEWQRLRERLQARGIPLTAGPVPRFGAQGNGIAMYFNDPDGNQIEARYYAESSKTTCCGRGSYVTRVGLQE